MFKKIMSKIKNSKGVSVTTEIVILIVIIVGIAISVGDGLKGVFVDDAGSVVNKLDGFIEGKFSDLTGTTGTTTP